MLQDVRVALRTLVTSPRFAVPALLALALGIGSTAAIFSVVRGVLLQPLPYPEPDRVVVVWENNTVRQRPRNVISAANYVEWRDRNQSFEALAVVGPARLSMTLDGQPEEVTGYVATSSLFAALGVYPVLGRAYTADEDLQGNDRVIVLGHAFWRARLGGRPDVVGATVVTNGVGRTVVGIMPADFTLVGQRADFLVPYGWTEAQLRAARGRGSSHGLARLRPGVSFEHAVAEMTTLAAQLAQEFPDRNTGWSITLVPVHEQMVDQVRPALLVLAGAVFLVLLVACANVANLLLARAAVRARELGIRMALGARRGRLVRQLLTESLLLAGVGGIAGLAVAVVFHRSLLVLAAAYPSVPRIEQVRLDLPVVGFTMLVAMATGLLFGIVPALVASSRVPDAVRDGGRHGSSPRSRRLLATLVVAEVALSLVLLAGAGLLARSLLALQRVDPGFRAAGLLTARVQPPGVRYSDDAALVAFYDRAIDRLARIPGVQSAAGISFLPLSGPGMRTSIRVLDEPPPAVGHEPSADVRPVTPGFFETMGMRWVSGRAFGAADVAGSPLVAVVSESLVRRYLPGEVGVGRRLHVNIGRARGGMEVEVVGVVGDIHMTSLDTEVYPTVYIPHTQLPIGLMTFVTRTSQHPASIAGAARAAIGVLDPELPLADVRTMEEVLAETLARPRAVTALLGAFALIALVLAAIGVYGVMAYSVEQRTREIGVRMALGATPGAIFGLVLRQALGLAVLGVVVGLVASMAVTRFLASLLFAVAPTDATTFGVTAGVLVGVAVVASYVPARRSTRVAPVDALRGE